MRVGKLAAEIEEGRARDVALVVVGAPAFGVVAAFGPRPQIGRAVEDAKRRRAHAARELLGRNQRRGMRPRRSPWIGRAETIVTPSEAKRVEGPRLLETLRLRSAVTARRQMVFCGSGGTATVPRRAAGAGERPAAASWPTSGSARRRVVVFLVFFLVVVGAALGVAWACTLLQAGAARGAALQRLAVGGRARLGLGGRHRGRRRRWRSSVWAKDGAAKATAARAAMLAINRRIGTSPGPLAEGDGAASIIPAKCYGICVIYVKFLIVYSS